MSRTIILGVVLGLCACTGMGDLSDAAGTDEMGGDGADGGSPDGRGGGGSPDGGGGSPDGGGGGRPHLIVAASGEDLGLLIDLKTVTVLVERVGAIITLGRAVIFGMPSAVDYYFVDKDCKGTPMIQRLLDDSPGLPIVANHYYNLGPAGTYVRRAKQLPRTPYQSVLRPKDASYDGSTTCMSLGPGIADDLYELADSGVRFQKPTYRSEELRVELR